MLSYFVLDDRLPGASMKYFLPLILSFSILFSSAAFAARSTEGSESLLFQAHEALVKANYGRAIAIYDSLLAQSKGDESASFTIHTSRGIAKALAGQMVEADADLAAAAKAIPVSLEELKKRDARLLILVVQMYQWRYLTHLTLKKWNDAVNDIDSLRTIGAASHNAGSLADRAKLNMLVGQFELGLTQLSDASKMNPAYKFEFDFAKKSLANEDAKSLYLAAIATQLIGSASALKLGFQQTLSAPKATAK